MHRSLETLELEAVRKVPFAWLVQSTNTDEVDRYQMRIYIADKDVVADRQAFPDADYSIGPGHPQPHPLIGWQRGRQTCFACRDLSIYVFPVVRKNHNQKFKRYSEVWAFF